MVLVWPVRVPGSGHLRSIVDADEDDVSVELGDDGALVLTHGAETLRVEHPVIESAERRDGGTWQRSHLGLDAVRPEVQDHALVLFRPVGDAELALVAASGWRTFPPRLSEQPIFYPVTNHQYALEIAERWNGPEQRGVHVLRFRLREDVARRWLPVRCVGARHHTELWVPANELDAFNEAIVGPIEEVERTEP